MPRAPFIAIADDLTGAAEIAAFGFRHGLESTVVLDGADPSLLAELVVFDSDSRLDEPRAAAEKLSALGRALAPHPRELLYKKTDSVLRGSVRAEVEALAAALGLLRIILLPANPSLGRRIRDGRYTIDGVPLHHTAFAHDPHHPATSDAVRDLLGDAGTAAVTVQSHSDPRPTHGLVVANAATADEIRSWARQLTPGDLAAGGGEFFAAVLAEHGVTATDHSAGFHPPSPTLIVSGTTSAAGATLRTRARHEGVAVLPMPASVVNAEAATAPAIDAWIEAVRTRLVESGVAVVVFDGPVVSDSRVAGAIRGGFARCVGELVKSDAVQHVIVEGGATAVSIARELGWRELRVAHEWAHGVASLRPANHASVVLTLKPGSYAWPESLWQRILRASPRVSPGIREKSPS